MLVIFFLQTLQSCPEWPLHTSFLTTVVITTSEASTAATGLTKATIMWALHPWQPQGMIPLTDRPTRHEVPRACSAPAVRSSFTGLKPHPGRQPSPKPVSEGLSPALTADSKCCIIQGSFKKKKKKDRNSMRNCKQRGFNTGS